MIAAVIRWSLHNRFLVLLASVLLAVAGGAAALRTPLDVLPDLSDVQVIIRTSWPGQAPPLVETQVTYPLTTAMLSVPGAKAVRGYSFFGDSIVYVLFEDGTDLYWARSRVLEYLNLAQSRLPRDASSVLGPDATGVGWIYQYALIDRSNRRDISELRALQDWYLKYELKTVPGVAEVASIGGMVRQYQVVLAPERLAAYAIAHGDVIAAIEQANQETGGSVLELGEAEYMVRASGYLRTLDDLRAIPLRTAPGGTVVALGDVARVQLGPEMRRGVGELNGEGEAAGGIVVMRSGDDALATIDAVKAKLAGLRAGLPEGVELVTVYDRSGLIERAVDNLAHKLLEEFVVVALVCALFLLHLRSALVAVISLPLGVLGAFVIMRHQGINADIMSLGGIAIAVGAMVDAAVVMIENAHKHLEHWRERHPGEELQGAARWQVIGDAAAEVGPALFFSLLIVTFSFLPVFALQAQEGRLFAPLAYTKTFAMAVAAGLAITLVPVLMGYLIRGKLRDERHNPLSRGLIALYRPLLDGVLRRPVLALAAALLVLLASFWPLARIGSEFMPPLDEGDLLYMPSALPGLGIAKAVELLQQTDRLIKSVPEVLSVYGKAGRAETATDPAPLEMFETLVRLKPRAEWREGMTMEKLIAELDRTVRIPGLTNVWVPPIRNRLDMLATGIKSPVGIKISGPDIAVIDALSARVAKEVGAVAGVSSAFAERLTGGRYLDVNVDRAAAARHGLNIADVQAVIAAAIGGENIGEIVEGLQRFPINIRYPRELRDTPERLRQLPIVTEEGRRLVLGDVADIGIDTGPAMLRSENARLAGFVYVDIRERDLATTVRDMQQAVAANVDMPAGYTLSWSGQFEFLERAKDRLQLVIPVALGIIFVLLYLMFRSPGESVLIMASVPFSLVGGIWLLWLLDYNLSVAGAIGFIALAGVAAEFGVIMLLYLRQAWQRRIDDGALAEHDLLDAIREGAVQRVRPKAMTVAVILAGLLPIMWGSGTGSEIMQRIAAPMIGGMITAPLLSMFVVPAAYLLLQRRKLRAREGLAMRN